MAKPEQEFIEALTKLSNEYGYHIWGCGCCGSPSVEVNRSEGQYFKGKMCDLEWKDFIDG
jgi:hypothetical protein